MNLPIVDLDVFREQPLDSPAVVSECRKAAEALITYGALVLHDSRVLESDNDAFLDLVEDYFAQPREALERDQRPELSFQIGVTLENKETPKCAVHEPCLDVIARLAPEERPVDISAHQPDPKCRFFWSMAEKPPYDSAFSRTFYDNIVPESPALRDRWEPIMNKQGNVMKTAVSGLAGMLAVGLGLPVDTFTGPGRYGPHNLAPTASYLERYGSLNTILAGFHTDIGFLSVHGRSRFPGLHIWARNTGKRLTVAIPPGRHLLIQAGKQLEHVTSGLIKAGYHEVVVNPGTLAAMQKRRTTHPDRPLIRISSTLFWHMAMDHDLAPLPELAARAQELRTRNTSRGLDEGAPVQYASMKAGEQVNYELKNIALMT